MSKRFILILVAIVLLFVGLSMTSKKKATAPTNSTSNSDQPTNHITGEGKKNVTLIEYGDYQCPACGAYYPLVKRLVEKYKSDIFFQFRNFPLSSIHPNAFAGARAAEAAGKQNKYWEMHDKLYEEQKTWSAANNSKSYFEQYAQALGLDVNKFLTDFSSDETNNGINADITAANKIGATSTPTFVLDGRKIDENPRDEESFIKLIEDAIAAKNK